MSAQATGFLTSWIVGSAGDCDIVVNDSAVSGRHCRLSFQADTFVLEDLGSTNGTFINGHRLAPNQPFVASPQDEVTLGRRILMPWPGGRQAPRAPDPGPDAQIITIGRSPESNVHLDYGMVSWNHARILRDDGGWTIEDLNSRNGTALNRIDNRIQRAPLRPEDEIYLGSYKIPASRILAKKHLTQGEDTFERVNFRGEQMVLGRDPSCDYPLDYPMISWQHAILRRTADGICVEDLGSRNGTFVNGQRVTGKTIIRPGQEIGLGSFRFQFLEDGGLVKREYIGNVTIEVCGVAVNAPNGHPLLDPISLTIFPSELVALMGPAGAGKTTFLKSLNGYTPPAAGRVLFNGADLYQFYDRFRTQMSYVPQDDIVHAQLTVREALYFSAKLRTDLTDGEIDQRIDKVLAGLGILDKKNTVIGSPEKKVLSGGQRKRVNIAMELINDTPVIFLDEPTSGLSSYDAEGVIQMLKHLSTEGKTIITTIHQPSVEIFKQFDGLIMISRDRGGRGALAYFGPAHPDSIEFFDAEGVKTLRRQPGKEPSPEMLLSGLAKRATPDWVSAYEQSRFNEAFVLDRSGKVPSTGNQAPKREGRGFGFGQWWTLVRRNLILKVRDQAQVIILLIQAPLFALLVGGVFHLKRNDQGSLFNNATGIEFLMVVAAIWFGCNNAARDIVGEWTVYQRERMVSLKLPSYVFSKLTVSAVLCLFQCSVLLGIVKLMCGLQADFFTTLGVLYLSSLVGAALGLCVSAVAPTTEAAIAMLPLILLPAIALGGGIHPVYNMPQPMPRVADIVPSRWAFEANLALEADKNDKKTVGQKKVDLAENAFPKMTADGHENRNSLRKCLAVLGAMFAFWLAVVLAVLRKRDVV
ncbi:MAG TPA: FHA domain-containing protein [Bryobacteraceae bacterium]|jgi:ABC-type multidrug transport system ATPase subunit|nr:FHA domain-containing protein [Bryobacteraceae bacterium]